MFSETQKSQKSRFSSEFSKKSQFRHVGFYYSGARLAVVTLPLFAKDAFGAKKSEMHPKMHFWAQKCIFGSKNAFWGPFCPLAAKAYETNGFWIDFWTFGGQNAKMSTFGSNVGKKTQI